MSNRCFVVVDGYLGDDGYIDGNIRIFSTQQKAEEYIKKYQEFMKKGLRPGDKFHDYYDSEGNLLPWVVEAISRERIKKHTDA